MPRIYLKMPIDEGLLSQDKIQEKLNAVDDIQLFLLYSSILLDGRGRNIDESQERA